MRARQVGVGGHGRGLCVEADLLNGRACLAVGEDGLHAGLPSLLQRGQVQGLPGDGQLVGLRRGAQLLHGNALGRGGQVCAVRKLHHEAAVGRGEEGVRARDAGQVNADAVAHAHLEEGLGGSAVAGRADGCGRAGGDQAICEVARGEQALGIRRDAVLLVAGGDAYHAVAGRLELRGGDVGHVSQRHGKADQGGRHVQVLEGAGHGVLAANGANAQVHLGHEGAQDRGRGLAPALGLVAELLEVLLEGQVHVLVPEACRDQLGHGLDDGQVGARELVGGTEVGVEAPGHAGHRGGLALNGQLGHHGHAGRELVPAAKGHEHRGRADGGVKALREALVGGHVHVRHQGVHLLREGVALPLRLPLALVLDADDLVLGGAVAGKELARDVHYGLAVPHHAQAGLLGHAGNDGGLKVLLVGVANELVHVLRRQGHGHALLGLADGQLRAVQALVLLGHAVEVNEEAVRQLANGNGDAACAKVVAALDEAAGVAAAEQALQLALRGGVALLDLRAVLLQRLHVVGLGGAGCAANAVATGAAAEQDDLVAGGRGLATHVVRRGGTHHGADLHALGHVAGVVQLVHLAGCEANLVAVAGVARGGRAHNLALRQLALHGLADGGEGVAGAGDAHGLVHVAAAGQRVANGAADAGCRATEGLNLRGVVVGLVLEEEEPVLLLAVHVHLALDGAGVDLLGLVQVLEDALGAQVLGTDGAHVHEADGLLGAAQLLAHLKVLVEGVPDHLVVNFDLLKLGAEGGVAAVVGPVGVDHLYFRDGRHAALAGKVLLAELDVRQVHGQAAVVNELLQLGVRKVQEAGQLLHHGRLGLDSLEGLAGLQRGLACLNRVDHVMLYGLHVCRGQLAGNGVDLGGADQRALALAYELHALTGGVCALVKLAGQVLHGKHEVLAKVGQVVKDVVRLRLREDRGDALGEELVRDALHVVAVEQAQAGDAGDAERVAQLVRELARLDVEPGLLLHVNARDHVGPTFLKKGNIPQAERAAIPLHHRREARMTEGDVSLLT